MPYGEANLRMADVVAINKVDTADLAVKIDKPVVRARHELQEIGRPNLADALSGLLTQLRPETHVRVAQ